MARHLANAVAEAFDHRLDYRLSVYLFMNRRGVMGKLVGRDPAAYSYEILNDFLSGFQTPSYNYVIDPGPGKERVDTKIKGAPGGHWTCSRLTCPTVDLLKVSVRSPDTECVILGGTFGHTSPFYLLTCLYSVGNDSGYIPAIEAEILFQDRIKLLESDMVLESFKRELPHLQTIAVPQLFEWRSYPREPQHEREARKRIAAEAGRRRAEETSTVPRLPVTSLEEEQGTWSSRGGESYRRAHNHYAGNTTLAGEETPRTWHSRKDPKDWKARPGKGATARYVARTALATLRLKKENSTACKNAWIAENPQGTEGEFQTYWETKGKWLYKAPDSSSAVARARDVPHHLAPESNWSSPTRCGLPYITCTFGAENLACVGWTHLSQRMKTLHSN